MALGTRRRFSRPKRERHHWEQHQWQTAPNEVRFCSGFARVLLGFCSGFARVLLQQQTVGMGVLLLQRLGFSG